MDCTLSLENKLMSLALNFRSYIRPIESNPCIDNLTRTLTLNSRRSHRHFLPPRNFSFLSVRSNNVRSNSPLCCSSISSSPSSSLVSFIGPSSSPLPVSLWNFTHRHVMMLNFAACVAAVSSTWLFFSAIPTLLAFKRAAESLEKLLDATREELPDTMDAIRLSGMEISDLTMELSDLGHEITTKVRRSTRAVHAIEEKLRRFTNTPSGSVQETRHGEQKAEATKFGRSLRVLREAIVKGRSIWTMFFTLLRYFKSPFKYFFTRAK